MQAWIVKSQVSGPNAHHPNARRYIDNNEFDPSGGAQGGLVLLYVLRDIPKSAHDALKIASALLAARNVEGNCGS